ncbi:MAG: PQQ-dependent sugar dehydrogenase [Gammaproteobacteria bacterium]|nr:PQQ-dependent sugar dehydrogenase [Pseudomonadales bacterium]MCP5349180.1 PQQ-dependent sugar dehydrogenase [Pseudomonadales bacterium]
MLRKLFLLATSGVILSLASLASAQSDIYYSARYDYRVETVVDGLVQPWSLAWLPGGDMLVTEKPGRLRVVRNGQLLPEAIPGTPEVLYNGQGGLFEVLPHPNFNENRWVYLSFSKPVGDSSTTAVVRGRFENDRLTNVVEIFAAKASGRPGHYGGKMAFDNDGHLFLSLGDRQADPNVDQLHHPAQDTSNHHGVIVRLNDDGSVPDDNPFVGDSTALPEIWSYGHRSPQGLAFHPETGDLWMTEHGPFGGDELNRIEPGKNYGWPVIGHGRNYVSGSPIHEGLYKEGMEQPVHFWVPSIATSGLMVYTGDKFPLWYGSIFAGGLAGEELAHLMLSDDYRSVVVEETLAYGMGRIRDVRQGPDGYIYLAISDQRGQPTRVVRLVPVE